MKQNLFSTLGKRNIKSGKISVNSPLGLRLLQSSDSRKIVAAVRLAVKEGKPQNVILEDEQLVKALKKDLENER